MGRGLGMDRVHGADIPMVALGACYLELTQTEAKMTQIPGYNDLDLMARSCAMQTLLLAAIAHKLNIETDPVFGDWLHEAEQDAHATLDRLEAQSLQRGS